MGSRTELDGYANQGDHDPTDEVLAQRAQGGDRDAFERLARRYLRPVHAVAASFLAERADVEDAAQETFLRALAGIRTYHPARPFAPWLYQIARNATRNRVKQRARHPTAALSAGEESIVDDAPSPAADVEQAELRRLLASAIDELPEQRRMAFRLTDVEGYPATEVARIMGLTDGAVRAHVFHARRDLRARLAGVLEDRNQR